MLSVLPFIKSLFDSKLILRPLNSNCSNQHDGKIFTFRIIITEGKRETRINGSNKDLLFRSDLFNLIQALDYENQGS